jgi:hypothetical protein
MKRKALPARNKKTTIMTFPMRFIADLTNVILAYLLSILKRSIEWKTARRNNWQAVFKSWKPGLRSSVEGILQLRMNHLVVRSAAMFEYPEFPAELNARTR